MITTIRFIIEPDLAKFLHDKLNDDPIDHIGMEVPMIDAYDQYERYFNNFHEGSKGKTVYENLPYYLRGMTRGLKYLNQLHSE